MLDPKGRDDVMRIITEMREKLNITVILITHYMNEAILADRVVVMKEGSKYLEGTPNEVFSKPEKLWEAGLEVPQSVELIDGLNKALNTEIPLEVYDLDTCAELIKRKLQN